MPAIVVVPTPNATMALSITAIMAASPLGISVQTIALGMGFAVLGLMGRFAFEVQKALEAGDKVKFLQALGWTGAGLFGAPFITVAWVEMLKSTGAQTDFATVIGLLFLGFTGPKGVTWLIGLITSTIGRISFGKGTPAPPKP